MSRRDGFTLLELVLAIAIALMLLTAAIPSIDGLFAEQRLKETHTEFEGLVREAHARSIREKRDFVLVWDPLGIELQPDAPTENDTTAEPMRLNFAKGATITMERLAALEKDPPLEWMFWRSGNCEPVVVTYSGEPGSWIVKYDPLSVRGTFIEQVIK
jgi:prepilin-type N-terminal cleavage/methylation domain-containing protein